MAAAQHAAHARLALPPPKMEVLSAGQAVEIEAASSRIIPSDETVGAREPGVVYFIDRALGTFAADSVGDYEEGILLLQAKTRELFPGAVKFSEATIEQQDAVLNALEGQRFFETIRTHTILGFLANPTCGGNRDEVGWKLIGYDSSPAFSPPFGYYDRDYPGWKPPG